MYIFDDLLLTPMSLLVCTSLCFGGATWILFSLLKWDLYVWVLLVAERQMLAYNSNLFWLTFQIYTFFKAHQLQSSSSILPNARCVVFNDIFCYWVYLSLNFKIAMLPQGKSLISRQSVDKNHHYSYHFILELKKVYSLTFRHWQSIPTLSQC